MLWADEILHVATAENGVVIISFAGRGGEPHEIALPEDQAALLGASLLATFAAQSPGARQVHTRYIAADVRMGQGPGAQPALTARFGPLQLALTLTAEQKQALKRSLDDT